MSFHNIDFIPSKQGSRLPEDIWIFSVTGIKVVYAT
jgi:hypothetical protein